MRRLNYYWIVSLFYSSAIERITVHINSAVCALLLLMSVIENNKLLSSKTIASPLIVNTTMSQTADSTSDIGSTSWMISLRFWPSMTSGGHYSRSRVIVSMVLVRTYERHLWLERLMQTSTCDMHTWSFNGDRW